MNVLIVNRFGASLTIGFELIVNHSKFSRAKDARAWPLVKLQAPGVVASDGGGGTPWFGIEIKHIGGVLTQVTKVDNGGCGEPSI